MPPKQIALSFDDGPSALTPRILDAFASHGGQATFFVLGDQIAGREHLLQRAVSEGHELGVHGWDHSRHALLGALERTRDALRGACGYEATLFRPTYGDVDPACTWPATLWDIDSEDWRRPEAGEMVANVLAGAFDGCVVDLHDGRRAGPETVKAVSALLPMLSRQGYRAVTISSLRSRAV